MTGSRNVLRNLDEEIRRLLDDPVEGAALTSAPFQWMRAAGVTQTSITDPWPIRSARVTFDGNGGYSPCRGIGDFALIIAILNNGKIDLVPWEPTNGRLATRLGIGSMLGEGQIGRDGIGTSGRALPVWRTPVGWLRADRCGVVVVDQFLAAQRLSGCAIVGEDARHDRELRRLLRVPPPRFVGKSVRRARVA